ncbi:MAG TPA: hypothetical protein VFL94_06200 [Actinomycetales bacterium]|nr:hypothetical protein [Actinomycetales bacterium]
MTVPPPVPTALLLLRGRADDVRSWARKGLLPVWLVPGIAWTLVAPAASPVAAPPYDDPVALLGGRPVPSRLRPAVCVVADGPRVVVAVHEAARRAVQRWLVWGEGVGVTRVEGLPHAPVGLLADAAAARGRAGRERLRDALVADGRRAVDVADDVVRALGLPGAGLLLGAVRADELTDAERVDPEEDVVARFDDFVAHEARLEAQLEDR